MSNCVKCKDTGYLPTNRIICECMTREQRDDLRTVTMTRDEWSFIRNALVGVRVINKNALNQKHSQKANERSDMLREKIFEQVER